MRLNVTFELSWVWHPWFSPFKDKGSHRNFTKRLQDFTSVFMHTEGLKQRGAGQKIFCLQNYQSHSKCVQKKWKSRFPSSTGENFTEMKMQHIWSLSFSEELASVHLLLMTFSHLDHILPILTLKYFVLMNFPRMQSIVCTFQQTRATLHKTKSFPRKNIFNFIYFTYFKLSHPHVTKSIKFLLKQRQ